MYQYFIGIDISKNDFSFSIHDKKEIEVFDNDLDGFISCFSKHEQIFKQALTVLETTGGYELPLVHFLQEKECAVHRANTRKVKYFIRSFGQLAKTDSIDARALAQYGHDRHASLELFRVNPQHKLAKLALRRQELTQMLVQEKNRMQSPDQRELRKSFNVIIKALQKELLVIEQAIEKIFQDNPDLERKRKVLEKVPGIGPIISMQLIATLPEIGLINRKKIASLAGLAPHPYESGQKVGYRKTRGGREGVKPILFMAAMTAARSKSHLGKFYEQLIHRGKKKMVALVALMRKIIVIANAKVRDLFISELTPQHG